LPESHPEAYASLMSGEFAVQRIQMKAFSLIQVDQTIEQTVNRVSKTPGGIIGFSLNKSAMQRWILTSHDRATVTEACQTMAAITNDLSGHQKASKTRIQMDGNSVQQMTIHLDNQTNIFAMSSNLIHLTSGVVASGATMNDLLNAENSGMEAVDNFIEKRLNSDEIGFYAPLKKMNLRALGSETLTQKFKHQHPIKADLDLFARLLMVAQTRQMKLQDIYTYKLAHVPQSLCSQDGSLCKTLKEKMVEILERKFTPIEAYSIFITDH